MGFVKAGNLPMVHGLVNHFNLGQSAILIRGCTDEFTYGKGAGAKKASMAAWNPLLVAVASKKLDIVKYFLNDLQIAIVSAGRAPDGSLDARFILQVAAYTQDAAILGELWAGSQNQHWTADHLKWVIRVLLAEAKWPAGFDLLLRASTKNPAPFAVTEAIFTSFTALE